MYDQDTIDQILLAPKVDEEFDLEIVPKVLTNAFARTVSARLNLLYSNNDKELFSSLEYLNSISAAYDAYAALLPDQESRASAAFISASAYQATLEAPKYESKGSYIDITTVSPDVCAALLFLLADAHADANDAAKAIATSSQMDIMEASLLQCIKNLAIGNIIEVANFNVPDLQSHTEDSRKLAFDALLYLLTCGIKSLAKLILGDEKDITEKEISPAKDMFLRVKKLSSYSADDKIFEGARLLNIYGGPLHLANLLLGIEKKVHKISLGMIECPNGISRKSWKRMIRKMVIQHPYLWRNHRDAIEKGYLTPGVSSVVSFPTGAGKSALIELKVATSLLLGKRVIFLAPTNELVEQSKRSLYKKFGDIIVNLNNDGGVISYDTVKLGKITVMTPEICMMSVSTDKEAFVDVGLIVLDECHILHSDRNNYSHCGLDAMLSILNLTKVFPEADLMLLSAMIKNTDDISEWIEELTERRCLSLKSSWKPTRQLRGCLVYPAEKISELKKSLDQQENTNSGPRHPSVEIRNKLVSKPDALFSLYQTWRTQQREDYTLLSLISKECMLSTGKSKDGWYLTPNKNEVSRRISSASAKAGMKTLVFVQSIEFCESNVKKFFPSDSRKKVFLKGNEERLLNRAARELGGREHCYLEVMDGRRLKSGAVSCHGLLLPEERELHESLFGRRDGVDVIFATTAVAEEMTQPSQIVIISGDTRFDPTAGRAKRLKTHEILNAAGHAGGAGQHSQGVVILIPSKVIDYSDTTEEIRRHWASMQSVFEQYDQCLKVTDPIAFLLNYVHNKVIKGGYTDDRICSYFLRKLAFNVVGDGKDSAEDYLNRSFCAFCARKGNKSNWLRKRIKSALYARTKMNQDKFDNWIEKASSITGFTPKIVLGINELILAKKFGESSSSSVNAILAWLQENPLLVHETLNAKNIEKMFGGWYGKCRSDKKRAEYAVEMLKDVLPVWMSGAPLYNVEMAHTRRSNANRKCKGARHFSLRVAHDFGFLASIPGRILLEKRKSDPERYDVPLVLSTLGSVVREGCDSPEALATWTIRRQFSSRVEAREYHELIQPFISSGSITESFNETKRRVRKAMTEFNSR